MDKRTFVKRVKRMNRLYGMTHKYRVDYLPENYNMTLTCWECGETKNRRLFPYRKQYKDNKEKRCKHCIRQNGRYRRVNRSGNQIIQHMLVSSKGRIEKKLYKRNLTHSLTKDQLYEIIEKQDYKCVYTGLELDLQSKIRIYKPSIDRICSDIGYHKHNIQFTIYWANQAKSSLEEDEFIKLIRLTNNYINVIIEPVEIVIDVITKKHIQQCINVCRASAKKRLQRGRNQCGVCNITYDNVWDIAQKQGMKCAYTGLNLDFREVRKLYKPSIDRIDSSKGYTNDNIQLTIFWANQAKSDLDNELFLDLIKKTYDNLILKCN